MAFITEANLQYLAQHKYQTTGYSKLDNILNHFWLWVVSLFPNWLAPNLITVIGLICMAGSYLIMVPYDTTFTKPIPSWIVLLSAFLQFMYQTLDACDGKQARKIGQSSPLGMLLDHGCDSLSSGLIALDILQGLSLGIKTDTILMFCGVLGVFYMATWEEYHTHYCRTQIGSWGVSECQFTVISLFIVQAIFGTSIWHTEILYGFTLEFVLIYWNLSVAIFMSSIMMYSVFTTTKDKLGAFLRLLPLIEMTISLILWQTHPMTPSYGWLVFMTHCVIFSAICSRVIICSVARMTFDWFDLCAFIELLLLIENHYIKILPMSLSVFAFSAFVLANYSVFVIGVVNQIANYLGISVFRVKIKQ